MFRFIAALLALVAMTTAQGIYYATASAYPYAYGAYAPSNLAGGVPAVVGAAYPGYAPNYYPAIGK